MEIAGIIHSSAHECGHTKCHSMIIASRHEWSAKPVSPATVLCCHCRIWSLAWLVLQYIKYILCCPRNLNRCSGSSNRAILSDEGKYTDTISPILRHLYACALCSVYAYTLRFVRLLLCLFSTFGSYVFISLTAHSVGVPSYTRSHNLCVHLNRFLRHTLALRSRTLVTIVVVKYDRLTDRTEWTRKKDTKSEENRDKKKKKTNDRRKK